MSNDTDKHWTVTSGTDSHYFLLHDADPRPSGATVVSGYEVVATFTDLRAVNYVTDLLNDDRPGSEPHCPLCILRSMSMGGTPNE